MSRRPPTRAWRALLAAGIVALAAWPATAAAQEDPAPEAPVAPTAPPVTQPPVTQPPAPTVAPTTAAPAATSTVPTPTTGPAVATTRPTTAPTTRPVTTPPSRAATTTDLEREARDQGTTISLPLPSTTDAPPQTSCTSVVLIGDSLSVGLDSGAYINDREGRISSRFAATGVRTLRLENSGGRSVVEHLDRQEGGETVARRIRRSGFHGCWVIALGTNDAANVAHGSGYGYTERIDRMMAIIGDDPVLWVDAKTLRKNGDYAGANMRMFDQALTKAHARYPALAVYEWSDVVADDWFQGDGIHLTTTGAAYRAALIPAALAEAFPAE